jgi:hypothetical protein
LAKVWEFNLSLFIFVIESKKISYQTMSDDFDELEDDQLYEDYEAYKALIEAGVSQKDALKKTGLTAQIVKDLEVELGEDEFKDEFKEVWGQDDDDFDEDSWKEEDMESDEWEQDSDGYNNLNSSDDDY